MAKPVIRYYLIAYSTSAAYLPMLLLGLSLRPYTVIFSVVVCTAASDAGPATFCLFIYAYSSLTRIDAVEEAYTK